MTLLACSSSRIVRTIEKAGERRAWIGREKERASPSGFLYQTPSSPAHSLLIESLEQGMTFLTWKYMCNYFVTSAACENPELLPL